MMRSHAASKGMHHWQKPTLNRSDGLLAMTAINRRHDKKQKIREKKIALKKNYGLIQDTVVLWEALRLKSTSPEEKQQLVSKIMSKVGDKLMELVEHHTASRVIQFCLKHGSPAQRTQILTQVCLCVRLMPLCNLRARNSPVTCHMVQMRVEGVHGCSCWWSWDTCTSRREVDAPCDGPGPFPRLIHCSMNRSPMFILCSLLFPDLAHACTVPIELKRTCSFVRAHSSRKLTLAVHPHTDLGLFTG